MTHKMNITHKMSIENQYQEFLEYAFWNFQSDCEHDNILVRNDWTCCNTCGNYEICIEKKEEEERIKVEEGEEYKYTAFVFYHQQETDNIKNQMKDRSWKELKIYLNWGYFDEQDEKKDPDGKQLAEKIKEIATKHHSKLDYTDFSKKLELIFQTYI